ncbi:MAG TPA: hypothetical protein VMB85_16695 [Bryobacteraceae bacterium]|nr:hypothetical protein [Bryobacteraceae bacterium]
MNELQLAIEKHERIEKRLQSATAAISSAQEEVSQAEVAITDECMRAAIEEREEVVDELHEKLAAAVKRSQILELRPKAIRMARDHQLAIVCETLLRGQLAGIIARANDGAPVLDGAAPWGGPDLTRRWSANDTSAAVRYAAAHGIDATSEAIDCAVRAIAATGKILIPLQ